MRLKLTLFLSILAIFFIAFTAPGNNAQAATGSISVNAPVAIEQGKPGEINVTIKNFGGQGNLWQLYITNCSGSWENKYPETTDTNQSTFQDRVITNDNFTKKYIWDTQKAGTGVCNHQILVKVFDSKGNYLNAKDEACIRVYSSDDPNKTGDCSTGSSSNSNGGSNSPTALPPDTKIDSNKFAGTVQDVLGIKLETNLRDFVVNRIIKYLFPIILGAAALIGIIMGGVMLISSAGDDAKAEKGKKTILYTVIGVLVATLALVIYRVVLTVVNIIV